MAPVQCRHCHRVLTPLVVAVPKCHLPPQPGPRARPAPGDIGDTLGTFLRDVREEKLLQLLPEGPKLSPGTLPVSQTVPRDTPAVPNCPQGPHLGR